ncbi:hypothetical protein, partial [Vibrio sp. HB161653]|uniref:hypothetical protein n=1 Tax=Vibrio sp. HB161653 TaxID=3068274 RepID=UPI00273F515B
YILYSLSNKDCELTVPSLSTRLVTQFIETNVIPKNLLIIINECPHRLIVFKLLKSFASFWP